MADYIDSWIYEMFKFEPNESIVEMVKEALSEMINPVKLWLFTAIEDCWTCRETEKLIELIHTLAPTAGDRKLIEVHKLYREKDKDIFEFMGVDRVPTILVDDGYIRYVGMPAGEEVKGFVETVARISSGNHGLEPHIVNEIAKIRKKIVIEVIVTPPCPYCPYAAVMANMFAYISRKLGHGSITSIIVEAYENPDIADKYYVTTVPVIAINGRVAFVGLPYEEQLLEAIKEVEEVS